MGHQANAQLLARELGPKRKPVALAHKLWHQANIQLPSASWGPSANVKLSARELCIFTHALRPKLWDCALYAQATPKTLGLRALHTSCE